MVSHTRSEPTQLQRGKAFHRLIQVEWQGEAEKSNFFGGYIIRLGGHKRRIEIYVDDDAVETLLGFSPEL